MSFFLSRVVVVNASIVDYTAYDRVHEMLPVNGWAHLMSILSAEAYTP